MIRSMYPEVLHPVLFEYEPEWGPSTTGEFGGKENHCPALNRNKTLRVFVNLHQNSLCVSIDLLFREIHLCAYFLSEWYQKIHHAPRGKK